MLEALERKAKKVVMFASFIQSLDHGLIFLRDRFTQVQVPPSQGAPGVHNTEPYSAFCLQAYHQRSNWQFPALPEIWTLYQVSNAASGPDGLMLGSLEEPSSEGVGFHDYGEWAIGWIAHSRYVVIRAEAVHNL